MTCMQTRCDQLGICHCPAPVRQHLALHADDAEPGRDVLPDYMSSWEWIADLGRTVVAAVAVVAVVGSALGYLYGRWPL